MRLWHKDIITKLPRKQLLGQHRECAALRGNGWGKKHSVVNYVFEHPYSMLYSYHEKVMHEMEARGYHVTPKWHNVHYRGKNIGFDLSAFTEQHSSADYPEHNNRYLQECIDNLHSKGIDLQ